MATVTVLDMKHFPVCSILIVLTRVLIFSYRVRSLPPQFSSLPAQAQRLILSGIQVPSTESSWTIEAQEQMLEAVGAKVVQCCLKVRYL